ncbi:hypothetical protein D3C86_2132700 [compost metagenome]
MQSGISVRGLGSTIGVGAGVEAGMFLRRLNVGFFVRCVAVSISFPLVALAPIHILFCQIVVSKGFWLIGGLPWIRLRLQQRIAVDSQ